jgi:HEAT repeat protein
VLLDHSQLLSASPAEILHEIVHGRLDIDHRVLHALLDRHEQTLSALLEVAKSDAWQTSGDLEIDIAQLFHALRAPQGVPFLVEAVRLHPDEIPDEIVEALHAFGETSIEALLELYSELDEANSEEVAFLLASFHIRDERIFKLLMDRFEFSASEGAFLLGIYGDPAAVPHLENLRATLGPDDGELKKEIDESLALLGSQKQARDEIVPLDIYSRYPEEAEIPIDLFSEEERLELLEDLRPAIRERAAHSFFNQHPNDSVVKRLFRLATSDENEAVRSRAWESLLDATDDSEIVEAMLKRLRDAETPIPEKASLLIGLSMETDRNEVRKAIEGMYRDHPQYRAKTLEAMWRSLHPSFRDYFARHLDDEDVEVRRSAVWGVGYYAVKPALDKLRTLFDDEDLRGDAIFAYGLALPNHDLSKGRAKGMLKRIEQDAGGLSMVEERLAMAALDERLLLSGKEAVFFPED